MLTRTPYQACPLCDAKDSTVFRKADCTGYPFYRPELPPVMTWMKCAACEHVYTDGIYTEEALRLIFSNVHPSQKVGFDLEKQRYVSARMIEKVLPYARHGHWLDVGFGNGSLLLTAQEFGFVPVGIDLRKEVVEAIKALGVEAHAIGLADFAQPARFDVISLCDVLEHMPYPGQSLQAAHALLRDDGILFVSMPNSDSIVWRMLDDTNANPYWPEMEHYHNFSRQRLYRLLRDTGFEPLRYGISERYRVCMEVVARKVK
jgi:SAM-dependent methyltransferase